MMDPLSLMDKAVSTAGQIQSLAKTMKDMEFKSLLADLMNNLADARLEVSGLKMKLVHLEEENQLLKKKQAPKEEVPSLKWGCYKFEGDETLYCVACYEKVGKKSPTSRMGSRLRNCLVCSNQVFTY